MTAVDPFADGVADVEHAPGVFATSPQQARSGARAVRPVLTGEQEAVADEVGARKRREAGLSLECVEDESAAGAAVAAMKGAKRTDERPGDAA